jgi:hypothetical protein
LASFKITEAILEALQWTDILPLSLSSLSLLSLSPPPQFPLQHWLDPYKVIKKQVGKGSYSFRFRVKLYPISPIYLFEEATRYFLALQIKEDLVNEKSVIS